MPINRVFQDEINASVATKKAAAAKVSAKRRAKATPLLTDEDNYKAQANERQVIKTAKNPTAVRKAYEEYWNAGHRFINENQPVDSADAAHQYRNFQAAKDRYVPAFEEAWIKYEGDIPFEFFTQFDEGTLSWFLHTLEKEDAEDMVSMYEAQARETAFQKRLDAEVDLRIEESRNKVGGFLLDIMDAASKRDLHAERSAPVSTAERARLRRKIEEEWKNGAPEVSDGFWEKMFHGINVGLGYMLMGTINGEVELFSDGIGYEFDQALSTVGSLMDNPINKANSPVATALINWRLNELEKDRQAEVANLRAAQGFAEAYANERTWENAQREWDEMADEAKEPYIAITDGNEVQAMGLFAADFEDDTTVKEQHEMYVSEYDAQLRENIRFLEEQELTSKDALLDGLAAWGNFTGDLAVGSLLLFNSDDIPAGDFSSYFEDIKNYDHSPAKLMGWDGSMLGIAFDFGMMTLFDPTTYMFGGGAVSATGRGTVRSMRGVQRMMDSAEMTSRIGTTVKFMQSPSRGTGAMLTQSGLDGIGQLQLLSLADNITSKVFSRGNDLWSTAYPSAKEVLTEHVVDLLPAVDNGNAAAAAKAIKKRGGFNRPIEIEITSSGTYAVKQSDEAALRAAVNEGWNAVPVQFKYVDDGLGGYSKAQIDQMVAMRTNLPDANLGSSFNNEAVQGGALSEFQAAARDSDTVLGTIERGGKTYTVKKTTVQYASDDTAGFTGEWAAFRAAGRASRQELRDFRDLWYVIDDAGEVVGGYSGYELVRKGGDAYKGLMHEALRVSEQGGDSFLPRLMQRAASNEPDFSVAGRKFLNDALDQRVGSRGKTIDDVWGDAVRTPDGAVDGDILSPAAVMDESVLFGGTTLKEQVDNIYKSQLLRNGRLEDATYTAVARGFQSALKKVSGMSDKVWGDYIQRFFTQRNLSRTFNTADGRAVEDAMDYLMRMWGDDTELLEKYVQAIADTQKGSAGRSRLLRTQSKRIEELAAEIDELKGRIGQVPDRLDPEVRAVLEGGETTMDVNYLVSKVGDNDLNLNSARDEINSGAPGGTNYGDGFLDAVERGDTPPIELGWEDGKLVILDGNHRLAASELVNPEVKVTFPNVLEDRVVLLKELKKRTDEAAKIKAESTKLRATLPDNSNIFKILDDAVDEYNRKYLATNKGWRGKDPVTGEPYIDPKTGLVKRKFLRHGRNAADEGEKGAARTTAGFSDELDDNKKLSQTLKRVSSSTPEQYDLGVSALDLAVAKEWGGAKYMRYTQTRNGHHLREAGHTMYNVWIIDKVLRPATAAVVTMDEAMRIVNLYGFDAVRQYMLDKAYFMEARVASAFRGHNPMRRESVQHGASALSAKGQERLRRLQDWGAKIKSDERTFFDQQGVGYTDISVSDPLYRTYAREWTNQFLNDSGFRAFLEGRVGFDKWWEESADAARLRDKMVNVKKGGAAPTKQEVYQGWDTIWQVLRSEAEKAGKLQDFFQSWRTAARETEATGRVVPLPDSVFDNFIPVRGAQKISGGAVNRMTDAFFDRFFMDPVNYRRGFIAETVRKTEMKRLKAFYADQGKTIVPDGMLEDTMRLSGWRSGNSIGQPEALAHMWADSGYIPESWVNQQIERTVQKELENILYVWNMQSRAGAQSKALFPFGKPYADMMAFWGREMFKKPILRGKINNDSFLNLQGLVDNVAPINPKPGALISRMAATDMYVDRGWIPEEGDQGEGLLPGSTSTDLSPLFFLPTEGDDILGSVLPGLGYVPLAFLDMVLNTLGPDPVEDPVGYNNMVQTVSEGLPYFEYQQGGMLSRVAGGGTLATMFSAFVDTQGYFSGDTNFNITSEFGDIGREIRRAREVSVLLADPEVLADIAAITDPNELELYITGLVDDANRQASASHLFETVGRWTVPAKSKYDTTGAELQQVWVDAGQMFPEFLQVTPTTDINTPEGMRQYASDIRSAFFDLEGWQRDLMVAANPAIAVNMVSSWDWTPKAINAGFNGTERPYRSGGLPEDILRHDFYVDHGYIRPIQPAHRARLIVGQVAEARDNSLKEVYVDVVDQVNDLIWDDIQQSRLMPYFEELQDTYGSSLGTGSAEQIWRNWSSIEEAILRRMEDEGEVFDDDNPRSLGIPSDAKPWGTTFRLEDTSARFSELLDITLTEKGQAVVNTLGLEWQDNMTGGQFHRMIADEIAQNESLAHGMYRASWDQYTTERLSFNNSAQAQMSKAKYDSNFSAEWRRGVDEWALRADNLKEQYAENSQGIPNAVRQQMVDDFNGIVVSAQQERMDKSDPNYIAWDVIWGQYESTFGARDWTPPKPLSPFEVDGKTKRGTTHTPIVRNVVDGDTLVVSTPYDTRPFAVRLLGVSAPEYGENPDEAETARKRLVDAVEQARIDGDKIYLVTDPKRFITNTDRYGRMLAWLWIGDEPFYFADEMNPRFTPSGGGE